MFHALYIGSTSACFELKNAAPFYAPEAYVVELDGRAVLEGRENVFSLFGLAPGRAYRVAVRVGCRIHTLRIETRRESCALSAMDFGATGDGTTDDTAAIQRAIALLPEGGRLFFPRGTYLTGPIFLKSRMTLDFSAGATLLGRTERAAYPALPAAVEDLNGGEDLQLGAFEGLPADMHAALITAEYARDIAIIGPGLIDGNAQNGDWWQAAAQDPVAGPRLLAGSRLLAGPRLLFLNRCKNVTIHGISAANAAAWHLHPRCCKSVAFYDVTVSAPKDSPNTDALDPESCDGVEIVGCRFSVGDDCIAVKAGKLLPALPVPPALPVLPESPEPSGPCPEPASRHTIRNCRMAYGHGAVTLGSEIAGGVRALSVSQCLFQNTDRGLRIKTRRGRGRRCDIDDIAFDNIRMEGVLTPIVLNMWYNCVDADGDSEYVQARSALPVDARTPRLGRFRFSNLDCTGAEVAACYCDGLPEQPIEAVTLEDVRISFAEDARPGIPSMFTRAEPRCRLGLYFNNVRSVTLRNVTLRGHAGEAVVARAVERIAEEGSGLSHV